MVCIWLLRYSQNQQTSLSLINMLTEQILTLCSRKQAYANVMDSLLIRENVKCLIIHKSILIRIVNCTQPKKECKYKVQTCYTHILEND